METQANQTANTAKTDPSHQRLLTAKELAQHVGVSVATVGNWRCKGLIPCIFVSRRIVRYRAADALRAFERAASQPQPNPK